MQIITVITQAMDMARRKFTRGEQSMLIDIFNGTLLSPIVLGQHLRMQVEDSFNLYPGMYEEKWGVNKAEMMDKILYLDPVSAVFLELWAVGFWAINSKSVTLEDYLIGKINLSKYLQNIITQIDNASDMLEKTKSAFKSGQVAEARNSIEKIKNKLEGLL